VTDSSGTRPRGRWWRYLLLTGLVGLLALVSLVWYASTDSFQAMVRRRLVAELEKITGGRVEVGAFHAVPFRFRVDVRNITIHGYEDASEVPYAHVDRLVAQIKIISAVGAELGFDTVLLEHPVVHLIIYPNGTTNQPEPKIRRASEKSPVEQLFDLSIGRLDVQGGELLWDNQPIPLDFIANDVSAGMSYSFFRHRYEGTLTLGKVDTKFKDFRPFAWHAEAQFNLGRNYVEIGSLKWSSGRSHLEAKGRLLNFHQPQLEGTYDGGFDLQDLGAIARRREARNGWMEVQGKGAWSLDQVLSEGKFQLRDLDWHDENVTLRNTNVNADFWMTNQQFRLTKIDARLLGGTAVGDLELNNWLESQPAAAARNAKAKKGQPEQKGLVRLRAKDISVSDLATALSTAAHPFTRTNLAGTANVGLDARWKGSPQNTEADITFDVVPPMRKSASEVSVTAHGRVTYRAVPGELEVAEFSASTPASQMQASGTLSSHSALRVSASTTNLEELRPVIATFGGPAEIPVSLHGRAAFNGTVTGKFSNPNIAGNLQVSDFDSLIPATSRAPEKRVHWDLFSGNVQLSTESIAARNAVLHHGDTDIHFDVSASLTHGHLTGANPFLAHIDIRNGDLAEIETLAGYDYPISGKMNLKLQASGTRLDPHGEGQVQLTNATLYGQAIDAFSSDLRLINGEAQLNNLQLEDYGGRVRGSAGYNLTSKDIRFNLTGTDFELQRIPRLQASRLTVDGHMDFTAQGAGTFEQPVINADMKLHDLSFDREPAGDFEIIAATQGADLRLTGRSHFTGSELAVDGGVHLRDDWPADLAVHFSHLDVDSIIRVYFGGRLTGHSAVAGELKVQGPLRRPRQLNVVAELNDFFADIENMKLRNDGLIRFGIRDQQLSLAQLHLAGDVTDFTAHGTAQLSGEQKLDLQAEGQLNLKLVESFNPAFTSSGTVTMALTVAGTMPDPIVQGRLQVIDGAISYADLPSGLGGLNGSLLFDRNRLQIETLTGHTGGGNVNLRGSIAYYHRQASFDLTAQGREVRLRYPLGVSSTADADLHLVGTTSAANLSGEILITKLNVTPGFDFASYLEKSKQSATIPSTSSLLNNVKLDVHIVTTPDLQMQTAMAKLTGDADLRMRGSAARPVLLGRVDILEGEVNFNGAKYRLERGDVMFSNPVRTEPVLDLQAATRVSDYDITVGLSGTLDTLRPNWHSEPPLPEADIINLLAMGRTREESQALQSSSSAFNQQASNLILAEALNSVVSNRAQRLFGVSRIKVDPQGLGGETSTINRGPLVTIEQQVANNLTLTYSTNVSQTTQQIIQAEYSLTRNVSIVALRDYNGVVSIDVKVRRRRK
jgi:translocation and assembly module TamB